MPVLLLASTAIVAYLVYVGRDARSAPSASPWAVAVSAPAQAPPRPQAKRSVDSLFDLVGRRPRVLADMDIAEMNLLCAEGLRGAGELDVDHCLVTLDEWAGKVRYQTQRHLYRVRDPRYTKHYKGSEVRLRAEFLLQVLQEDLGVKYDMTAVGNFSFRDSRVAFLHGMIPPEGRTTADVPGGTCASMPVMYVAVGRRLGYPLKLVTTRSHVFVRWDGLGHENPAWRERLNIEGTGHGISFSPDDHYKQWPKKVSDAEIKANRYLVSLAPHHELALFLGARAHCLVDNADLSAAAYYYEQAYRYDPARPCYRNWFVTTALKSNYRPQVRSLARLLDQRRQTFAGGRAILSPDDPIFGGLPGRSPRRSSPGGLGTISPQNSVWYRSPHTPATPSLAPGTPNPTLPSPHAPVPGHWPSSPAQPHPRLPQPYRPPVPGMPRTR